MAAQGSENPSIMSHVSIGTDNLARATAFYDAVLATLGAARLMQHAGAVAYGRRFPQFWVQTPFDGGAAAVANGVHFAFDAPTRKAVQAFWDIAMANGAAPEGEPGPRPHYGAPCFGCFLRDPDGHKIEAVYWDASVAAGQGAV